MLPETATIHRLLTEAGVRDAHVEDSPKLGAVFRVAPADALHALRALKHADGGFDFLVDLFGIDTGDAVDVVYHLRSFTRDEDLRVKVEVAYGSALQSAWEIHPAALMPERECAEMFGLTLEGHPNPKYLLLTEGSRPMLLKSELIRTAQEVRNR